MSDRSTWYRSRDPKPPYASTKFTIHMSEQFLHAARDLLFDLPGRPFKSVQELVRHALAVGLESMVDDGVPLDTLRSLYNLADRAQMMLEGQAATNRLLDDCRELLRNATTQLQLKTAREFVQDVARSCPDGEIRDSLTALL